MVGGYLIDTTRLDDDADFVACESGDGWWWGETGVDRGITPPYTPCVGASDADAHRQLGHCPEAPMTQFFAAYDDASLYAIGTSADEAIATARAETQAPDAQFQAARISTALAAYITTHGWDLSRRFAVVGGYLIDTTRLDEDADFVVCESGDGWSLHAPDSTDDEIAGGEALPLASGTGRPTREDYDIARAQLDSPARASTWALRCFALASSLTPTELSRVIGRDDRTMRRWLAGEQDVPDTLAQQIERVRITRVDPEGVHLTYRR